MKDGRSSSVRSSNTQSGATGNSPGEAIPKVLIRLWDHVGTGIIIRWPSGIVFTNQACSKATQDIELECIFVPAGNPLTLDGNRRVTGPRKSRSSSTTLNQPLPNSAERNMMLPGPARPPKQYPSAYQ